MKVEIKENDEGKIQYPRFEISTLGRVVLFDDAENGMELSPDPGCLNNSWNKEHFKLFHGKLIITQ